MYTAVPQPVSGLLDVFETKSWYALWDGRKWHGPERLTSDGALNWQLDHVEAHWGAPIPMMVQWTGSAWEQKA